jgi:predicted nucleic acid-binding Zn ribbon protein
VDSEGDSPDDAAFAALQAAQAAGRTRGSDGTSGGSGRSRFRGTAAGRRTRAENMRGRGKGRKKGGYSGPAPDDTDPQLIGSLLQGYVSERGWERPLADARVFSDWPQLVGADIAAHCTPTALRDGELRVSAESTAWATQLRLLSSTVLKRLADELGPQTVRSVIFTGPAAPSWKHGAWSVRGARGPRDTYG